MPIGPDVVPGGIEEITAPDAKGRRMIVAEKGLLHLTDNKLVPINPDVGTSWRINRNQIRPRAQAPKGVSLHRPYNVRTGHGRSYLIV